MHASPQPSGRKDQNRRKHKISAFGRASPNHLVIPKLDKAIKTTLEFDKRGSVWAEMALLWLDAGELTEADSGHPRVLAQTAIHRWMEKQVAGMQHLNLFDIVIQSRASGYNDFYRVSEDEDEDESEWFFGLVADGGSCGWYQLEKRITALEEAHPGLGQTALRIFEKSAAPLPTIITPIVARHYAERLWWYYQDTQEDFEEELKSYNEGDNDERLEEVAAEGPDWFDAQFPGWMFGRFPQSLTEDELAEIASSSASQEAREVATLLLELNAVPSDSYRLPLVDGGTLVEEENAYFMGYLRWNETDPLERLNDDHIENANCCGDGYTDLIGAEAVPFDQAGFFKWKSEMEAGFAVLRKLDALLPLIADPCEEKT